MDVVAVFEMPLLLVLLLLNNYTLTLFVCFEVSSSTTQETQEIGEKKKKRFVATKHHKTNHKGKK